jgi:hypothetical protein
MWQLCVSVEGWQIAGNIPRQDVIDAVDWVLGNGVNVPKAKA